MSKKEKEKLKFIFPDIMSKFMKKVDMRVQMESSMMSISLIMIGMITMVIYLSIYGQMGWFYKGLIIFNLLCGFVFISSFLVTTYHQYLSYMEMANIDPEKERREILKKGNIFKRIKLAMKRKKKKEMAPQLVEDATQRMITIKEEEMKDYKKLQEEADKLMEEENKLNKDERR